MDWCSSAASRDWKKPQRDWLAKLGNQIIANDLVEREDFERDGSLLRSEGGYEKFNGRFDGKLDEILGEIHESIWRDVS